MRSEGKKIKIIVQFSGGKDSLASLLWTINESGYKKENIEAVFCDTGWEHDATYTHIKQVTDDLNIKLVTLKSQKYDGMVDLAKKKGRFPSTKARFCTEELKTKPMIDYILDECKCHVIIIQGIRKDESHSRSLMGKQCSYFKYYDQPYGKDKNGKEKFHTYRKKEVLNFRSMWLDDVIRPVFEWSGNDVMNYIFEAGFKPNPLYYQGAKRVGCYPCIMCSQKEIKGMIENNPDYIDRLKDSEIEVGRTFFAPDYIPKRAMRLVDEKTGKKIPSVDDVVNYIKMKDATGYLFEEEKRENRSCMSFYGICE